MSNVHIRPLLPIPLLPIDYGVTQSVQRCDNLLATPPIWDPVETFVSYEGETNWIGAVPNAHNAAFYRVQSFPARW